MNMGHRMAMVHNFHEGKPLWPSWKDYTSLFKHGCVGVLAFLTYMGPGALLSFLAYNSNHALGVLAGLLLTAMGAFLIPGFMTFYCVNYNVREVFDIITAVRRIRHHLADYLHAWRIVLFSGFLSLFGLLLFGIGFFVTTVWNWQVAAYCFCSVFKKT